MGLLDGKIALVAGVANKRSLAWAIARRLAEQGATLAFTYQGERIESTVRELAASVGSDVVIECDVADDASIDKAFAELVERVGGLDLMVHSIAFAQAHDLAGRFTDTKRDDYRLALDISAYSLVAMTQRAEPLMEARGGGAIVTMTYLGGERAIPGYNVMGVAKAALDASMRYLAADLGPKNIRVNAISAGPVRTLAARGIAGFSEMEGVIAERAPLQARDRRRRRRPGRALPALADGLERDRDDPLRRRRLPRDGHLSGVIRRPALHVLGCATAGGNPGEPCSGYLVTAGGSRILLDCGPGVVSSLLARDAAPLDAIVLSHLHFDHVGDLIPLGYAHTDRPGERVEGAGAVRPAGRRRAARGPVRGGRRAAPITSRTCGMTVSEYDVGSALAIGDAELTFRELVHPGTSRAIRVEAGGGVLVFSGDTALTPALGEHAAGRRPAADARRRRCPSPRSTCRRRTPAASRARRAARRSCSRTSTCASAAAALRQAREAFGGPVLAAVPGLRVAA